MTPEVTKLEIQSIKEVLKEQKHETRLLAEEVSKLKEALIEIRVGRKWLIGLLSAATATGAIIDTLLRALKVY